MKESQSELTSALLDGELDAQTGDRVVSRMLRQEAPSEIERFGRYHLIGDVLRGEASVDATAVSVAVSAALESEPTILAPPRRKSTWIRPLTGVALAASVAAAAIVIAPQLMSPSPQAVGPTTIAVQSPQLMDQPRLVAAGSGLSTERVMPETSAPRWQTLDKKLEDRLNQLLIEHHEFGGRTGVNGPVAHIGLVSYDNH